MRPRLPLPCPRMSSTVTVKMPAHLLALRQMCRKDITGNHAALMSDRMPGCPGEAGSLRESAALSREPRLEHEQHAPQQRPRRPRH